MISTGSTSGVSGAPQKVYTNNVLDINEDNENEGVKSKLVSNTGNIDVNAYNDIPDVQSTGKDDFGGLGKGVVV